MKVFCLKKEVIAVLLLLTLSVPIGVNGLTPPPKRVLGQGQALVLSSMNETVPMGNYATDLIHYLNSGGYNVTYLTDGAVTVDFLLNNLNHYSVVIWRTNTFNWVHTTYWYLGEKNNDGVEQKYASDFASGWLNDHTGVVGITPDFVTNHFGPNTLTGVKLLMLMASQGNSIAPQFLTAGVSTIIYCNGAITLQFGLFDDLTVQMTAYLVAGETVYDAVYNTISPFDQGQQQQQPIYLDTTYAPPFWFIGNDSLTID